VRWSCAHHDASWRCSRTVRSSCRRCPRATTVALSIKCWVRSQHVIADLGTEEQPQTRVRGARVLVVDDNPDMRTYLQRLLGEHWDVTTATDGEQALRLAGQLTPDLVLADVMLPRMDGFELLTRIRAEERLAEIPVVLLTARAGEDSAVEGLMAGADDYVIKPFSARELVARIAGTT
jgi:CheY-like chemotaxis protein